MADYLTTDTELTSIANAIRTKGGTSASLTYPNGFVSAIAAIPTGGGGGVTTDTDEYGFLLQNGVAMTITSSNTLNFSYSSAFLSDDSAAGFWDAYTADDSSPFYFEGQSDFGSTLSGSLTVTRNGDIYELTFESETSAVALLFVSIQ